MGKGGKRRSHGGQSTGGGSGKKQKQAGGKASKDDGDGSATIVLTRSKRGPAASSSNFPVSGLMNLGNTCFFNSVMQTLSQTHYLQQRMAEVLSVESFSLVLPSPRESLPALPLTITTKPGKFAQDFHSFIGEMRSKPKQQPLNPRVVFTHVCKNAPRFSSYQQQDSQELLRYLLDALKNEEVHRIKRAILDYYNVRGKSAEKLSISDQEKRAIKTYGNQAMQVPTFVEDVFGGSIVSSVTCKECHTCYEMDEDFLDLSLPVPFDSPKAGFSSTRSSFKGKKRFGRHSSEDAEGDDEGEGFNSAEGNYKGRGKEEPPVRLSKHQMNKKRKEEKKRSKLIKQQQKFSLDQFNKAQLPSSTDKDTPPFIEPEPLQQHQSSLGSLHVATPPPNRSASETTMDHQDSCLADDEVTLLSTQQDSDSSALFMQPTSDHDRQQRQDNSQDNDQCESVGDEDESTQSSEEKHRQEIQNFTADSLEDTKADEQGNSPTSNGAVDPTLNNEMGKLSLGHDGNQNLSESVVAMYEANAENREREGTEETSSLQKTPLQSPRTDANGDLVFCDEEGRDTYGDDEWEPKFGPRSREVSVTNVESSLQNIDDTAIAGKKFPSVEESEEQQVASTTGSTGTAVTTGTVGTNHTNDDAGTAGTTGTADTTGTTTGIIDDTGAAGTTGTADTTGITDAGITGTAGTTDITDAGTSGTAGTADITDAPSTVGTADITDATGSTPVTTAAGQSVEETGLTSHESENQPSGVIKEPTGDDAKSKATSESPKATSINKFSLEFCMHLFTSTELLTGSDRFCCESCTEKQHNQRDKHLPKKQDKVAANDPRSPLDIKQSLSEASGEISKEDVSKSDEDDKSEDHLSALVERDDETNILERSASSSSASTSCKEEDEDTEMIESTKESDDNMDDESHGGGSSGSEGAVFRDAVKQMLIGRPPAVLCLHLKRFIQQGRNFKSMKKNSCFISFPLVLDISPYCTQKLRATTDQVMYALYGVVVHGGGMHGGHYTAFVRVRNELQLKDVPSSESLTSQPLTDDPESEITTKQDSTNKETNGLEQTSKEGICDETNTRGEGATAAPIPNPFTLPRTSSPIENQTEGKTSNEPKCTSTGSTNKKPHSYDPFITATASDGTWYHISDSHVRKSTESEVLKAEAYLLFYERLPSSKKN